MYEFKMTFFDNREPEELLLIVWNFNMTLKVSGILGANKKLQYLRTILRGKALQKLKFLCLHIVSMTVTNLNHVVLGLGMYSPLTMHCLNKSAQCSAEQGRKKIKSEMLRCLYG